MNKRKRLLWQLYPSYLIITLLSLLAVSWYASYALRHRLMAQARQDLKVRALLLEKQIRNHLAPLNTAALDMLCKEKGASSATRITILLPGGEVVGDSHESVQGMQNQSGRAEIRKALSGIEGSAVRYGNASRKQMMYFAMPLTTASGLQAIVRTAIPVASIQEAVRSFQLKIGLGVGLIALIATLISWIVSRRIIRPIEQLKKGADALARGDLSFRMDVPNSVEIAALAEAMNQMAAQLDNRIKTIIEQRNELETVLSSMLEGVIAVNKEEHIISMNQAAAEAFEVGPKKIQDRSIQEVIRNRSLQHLVSRALTRREPLEEDITIFQKGEPNTECKKLTPDGR